MIGKHLVEFFPPLGVQVLNGPSDLLVNLLPSVNKKAVVSHLLDERMSEYVLKVREKVLLVDEFQPLKVYYSFAIFELIV